MARDSSREIAVEGEVVSPVGPKLNAKGLRTEIVKSLHTFRMFKGALYAGFERVDEGSFARLAYQALGTPSINEIKEMRHAIQYTAEDVSHFGHLVQFGERVWDMRELRFRALGEDEIAMYGSAIEPNADTEAPLEFLKQLALGDEALARDYLQAIAPLFMERKPVGVIWFVGSGANGKSSLVEALYRIIGEHLTGMTLADIVDGRDVPRLQGVLGNVLPESSEGRIDDTSRYKSIGTHEAFYVHKFHSQDSIKVETDFHTIFNTNNIPVFSDKTGGARRRTVVVPFPATFREDNEFNDRVLTPHFLGGLLTLILETAEQVKSQGYRYAFSSITMHAKEDYDNEANSVEAYYQHLVELGVEAFVDYTKLKADYDNWCSENAFPPLGVTNLRRVFKQVAGTERRTIREDGEVKKWYFFANSETPATDLLNAYGKLGIKVGAKKREEVEIEQKELSNDW